MYEEEEPTRIIPAPKVEYRGIKLTLTSKTSFTYERLRKADEAYNLFDVGVYIDGRFMNVARTVERGDAELREVILAFLADPGTQTHLLEAEKIRIQNRLAVVEASRDELRSLADRYDQERRDLIFQLHIPR